MRKKMVFCGRFQRTDQNMNVFKLVKVLLIADKSHDWLPLQAELPKRLPRHLFLDNERWI